MLQVRTAASKAHVLVRSLEAVLRGVSGVVADGIIHKTMPITKLISGGQTGADMGGLFAASTLDIPTGGWACKGWRTEEGPAPWLAQYGLVESTLPGYDDRTVMNIRDSDGTVVFGGLDSRGSRLTWDTCSNFRPCVHFEVQHGEFPFRKAGEYFRDWVRRYNIRVLNVAGNRESRNPGIQTAVTLFLLDWLEGLKELDFKYVRCSVEATTDTPSTTG